MTRKRLTAAVAGILTVLVLAAACGASDDRTSASSPSHSAPSSTSKLVLVALGDSSATGAGDATGVGWVGAYARLVETASHREVDVRNHAEEGQTSTGLLATVRGDSGALSDDIRAADFVVFGIGGGDLNEGDSAYLGGKCEPGRCYAGVLRGFDRNIETLAAEVARMRAGNPVVLRAITPPNVVPGAEDVIPAELLPAAKQFGLQQAMSLRDSTCKAMRAHGGECIDVLTAFNGPAGTANAYVTGLMNHADCCYPSTTGQQVMADLLFGIGIAPTALR